MLHGTKEQPYKDLPVSDNHSKLAIVKKAHEDAKKHWDIGRKTCTEGTE